MKIKFLKDEKAEEEITILKGAVANVTFGGDMFIIKDRSFVKNLPDGTMATFGTTPEHLLEMENKGVIKITGGRPNPNHTKVNK